MVMVFNGHMVDRDTFLNLVPIWMYEPSPTTWINESEMSDQEKIDNPTFNTCAGYLRQNDWMAEWKKAFAGATAEDVQKARDLPGFDAGIFKEITGLDLSIKEPCAPPSVTINGIKYVRADK
jgi:hypothetical protein